jgi:hypothetical protein
MNPPILLKMMAQLNRSGLERRRVTAKLAGETHRSQESISGPP